MEASVTVRSSQAGYESDEETLTQSALVSAHEPVFDDTFGVGGVEQTEFGFQVKLSSDSWAVDDEFTWQAEFVDAGSLPGAATVQFDQDTGVVTVDLLRPGQSAQVRVVATAEGYLPGSATRTEAAATGAAWLVEFESVTRGPDAGVVSGLVSDYAAAVEAGFEFEVVAFDVVGESPVAAGFGESCAFGVGSSAKSLGFSWAVS